MEKKTAKRTYMLLCIIPLICSCLSANIKQAADNNPEQALTVSESRPKAGDIISGIVRDQEGPLVYAIITVRDSLQRPTTNTLSDEQGRFSFKLKNPNDRILISYAGMEPCILEITDTVYEVILKPMPWGMIR